MDNLALFIFGIAITGISGMGVVVYMASLGYQRNEKKPAPPAEVDADLGASDIVKKSIMDSFVGIPSVS